LAQVDSEGVYLTGRSSDLINVAGRKLAPELVEQALRLHPAVRECIVFGITSGDAERADEIVACITLAQDVPTALLRQFLLERLEAWQTPRLYWVVNDLPANERGKLSRAHWRARYLEGRGGVRDP
jgi:acyl-coenzyme A synthetase/AMP-(fatty) acid ligase